MPQSLDDLEQQRSAILHRLTDLGDLRPGFHYHHFRSLWQAELPLSPSERTPAWTD